MSYSYPPRPLSDVSRGASYHPIFRKIINVVMLTLTGFCTLLAIGVLFTILIYLLWNGAHALNWNFFTKLPAPVGQSGGGVVNAILGTIKLLVLASAIGVPIGLIGGIYLSEFAGGWSGFAVRYTTDLLNGVPSVVMGIFVYTLVVLPMHHFSTLAGGIALGIMMIPIALRSTEDFLRAVPRSLREGGLALGASKSETIVTIVIPAAIYGIITGVMLDIARVAGETAPLLFTAFGNQFNSPGWLQPTASLPVVIYNYAISPYDQWHQQAWAAGFVLLSGLLVVSIVARVILARGKKLSMDSVAGPAMKTLMKPFDINQLSKAHEVRFPGVENREREQLPWPQFTVADLNFFYGRHQALKNINLIVPNRRVTAFIGPSGCGKTTLLRTFNRMNETVLGTRVEGSIRLGQQDLFRIPATTLRRVVGMVFQKPTPFPKSIFDNVAYGLRLEHRLSQRQITDKVEHSLRRAALWDEVKDKLHQSANGISGGQQQRLCIARALAVDPEVLLLDEPCSALDPISTAKIEDLLFDLKNSCTIVMVTHNMLQAARIADYVGFFLSGELIELNRAKQIFQNPEKRQTQDYITGRFG